MSVYEDKFAILDANGDPTSRATFVVKRAAQITLGGDGELGGEALVPCMRGYYGAFGNTNPHTVNVPAIVNVGGGGVSTSSTTGGPNSRRSRIHYETIASGTSVREVRAGNLYIDGGAGFRAVAIAMAADPASHAGAVAFTGIAATGGDIGTVLPSTLVNAIGLARNAGSANMHVCLAGNNAQSLIDLGADFPLYDGAVSAENGIPYRIFIDFRADGFLGLRVTREDTGAAAEINTEGLTNDQRPAVGTFFRAHHWLYNNNVAQAAGWDFIAHEVTDVRR